MKNNEAWNELIEETTRYPADLRTSEARFQQRLHHEKRKRRAFFTSLTAAAASIGFILLVNISPAFAGTLSGIPVLGEIAEFVRFDKTLSHVIQHEYIQEVGLTAEDGEVSLHLPYLIADEHNLVLFFKIPKDFESGPEQWVTIQERGLTDRSSGQDVQEYSLSSGSMSTDALVVEDQGYIRLDYQFGDTTVPKDLDLTVELKLDEEIIGTFDYSLTLDDFASPRIYDINEKHRIFGQEITVQDIAVYPTGTEVNILFSEDNSALVKGLDLVLVQEDSTLLSGKTNGLTASYSDDWMRVFVEAAYFGEKKEQKLYIKGARLLEKEELFITVDLKEKRMTPAIEGLALEEVIADGENASLVFSSHAENDHLYSIFSHEYTDGDGHRFELSGEGTSGDQGIMRTYLTVKVPDSGKVVLERNFAGMSYLDEPIVIDLPLQ